MSLCVAGLAPRRFRAYRERSKGPVRAGRDSEQSHPGRSARRAAGRGQEVGADRGREHHRCHPAGGAEGSECVHRGVRGVREAAAGRPNRPQSPDRPGSQGQENDRPCLPSRQVLQGRHCRNGETSEADRQADLSLRSGRRRSREGDRPGSSGKDGHQGSPGHGSVKGRRHHGPRTRTAAKTATTDRPARVRSTTTKTTATAAATKAPIIRAPRAAAMKAEVPATSGQEAGGPSNPGLTATND